MLGLFYIGALDVRSRVVVDIVYGCGGLRERESGGNRRRQIVIFVACSPFQSIPFFVEGLAGRGLGSTMRTREAVYASYLRCGKVQRETAVQEDRGEEWKRRSRRGCGFKGTREKLSRHRERLAERWEAEGLEAGNGRKRCS